MTDFHSPNSPPHQTHFLLVADHLICYKVNKGNDGVQMDLSCLDYCTLLVLRLLNHVSFLRLVFGMMSAM